MSAGLIAITKGASVAGSGTLGANQIPYANSAGELQGSSALTFEGAVLTAQGSVRAYSNLFVYGESGDRLNITPQAAGSGVLAVITNNANTDYAPLVLDSSRLVVNSFGAEVARFSGGNLGLGVTPYGWENCKAVDISASAGVFGDGLSYKYSAGISQNAYVTGNGTVWKYKLTGPGASVYMQEGATHTWKIASGGTAGNTITFTDAMTLDSSGNLIVGTTSAAGSSQFTAYGASNGQIAVQNQTNWSRLLQNGNDTYIDNGVGGSAGNIIFRQSSSTLERMRIDSAGRFYVGTTGDGASRFMVSGGQFRVSSGSQPWFVMGSGLTAGSYGTFHKGNTTTAVGYIGTDGGGITGAGSGDNFGLRAEGALLLYSGGSSGSAMTLDASGNLSPGTDNSQTLGSGSYRWSVVYAGTGTINTSDAREKTKVSLLEDKEIEAAAALSAEIGKFQFLSSIESKGEDKARIHLGMTVQRAIEIMEKNSLDPMRYAFICYDKWEEEVDAVEGEEGAYAITSTVQKTTTSQVEEKVIEVIDGVPTQKTVTKDVASPVYEAVPVVDEDGNPVVNITPAIEEELDEEGNVVKEAIPEQVVPVTYQVPVMETVTTWKKKVSKDRYGFRYDQLIMFIAKGLEARFTRAIQGLVG